jgi:hypothetical protein
MSIRQGRGLPFFAPGVAPDIPAAQEEALKVAGHPPYPAYSSGGTESNSGEISPV